MNAEQLTGYTWTGTSLGTLPYIEVQWNRKWHDFGDFTCYMRAEDYPGASLRYVKLANRPEYGVVQKVEFDQKVEGDFITLSGFFIEKLLDGASSVLTYNIANLTDLLIYIGRTCGSVSRTPDTTYTTVFPETTIGRKAFWKVTAARYYNQDEVSGVIEPKTGVGTALYNILSAAWSYEALPLFNDNGDIGIKIGFTPSRDKTSLVFSKANGNVAEMKFSQDDSGRMSMVRAVLKLDPALNLNTSYWDEYYDVNNAKIYTGDDGYNLAVVHSDQGSVVPSVANDPTVIYDVDQVSYELTNANLGKIQAEMRQKAQLELLNHSREYGATFKALQKTGYEYLTDYDLGDKITVYIPLGNGQSWSTRITEVREVHKANHCEIELTTGTLFSRRK